MQFLILDYCDGTIWQTKDKPMVCTSEDPEKRFSMREDIDEDIKRYNQHLAEARLKGDKPWEGEILFALGVVYSTILDKINIGKAIGYHKQAIDIFRQEEYWFQYYKASHSLGFIYELLVRDLREAIKVYETAIEQGQPMYSGSWAQEEREKILHSISRVKRDLSK